MADALPPKLKQMVNRNDMSAQGAAWLVQTLDPFSDIQRTPCGYPDTTVGASFIEKVQLVQNFTVPAPGQAMDLHIFTLPQLGVREVWNTPLATPTMVASGLPSTLIGNFGTVTVLGAFAGFPTLPYFNPTTGLWTSVAPAPLNYAFDLSPFLIGDSRLVSLGVEVHNTSPELIKSGSVVTYRSPQSLSDSMIYTVSPVTGATPATELRPIVRSTLPPATQAAALLLSGSQQWEAYDGAYITATMQTQSNPIEEPTYADQYYLPSGQIDGAGVYAIAASPRISTQFPNTATYVNSTPWNTSGAYLAGLQPGTTLTVNVTAYIECFPQPDQYAYMTLTHPSTPFDPSALELYAKAAYELKPGTKVANNADGDHYVLVSKLLDRLAPRVAKVTNRLVGVGQGIKNMRGSWDRTMDLADALKESKIFGQDVQSLRPTPIRGNAAPNSRAVVRAATGGGAKVVRKAAAAKAKSLIRGAARDTASR
jgi:hypothetical protein